jgi:hypothetical protein
MMMERRCQLKSESPKGVAAHRQTVSMKASDGHILDWAQQSCFDHFIELLKRQAQKCKLDIFHIARK